MAKRTNEVENNNIITTENTSEELNTLSPGIIFPTLALYPYTIEAFHPATDLVHLEDALHHRFLFSLPPVKAVE